MVLSQMLTSARNARMSCNEIVVLEFLLSSLVPLADYVAATSLGLIEGEGLERLKSKEWWN